MTDIDFVELFTSAKQRHRDLVTVIGASARAGNAEARAEMEIARLAMYLSAKALIEDASTRHQIENVSKVYLVLGPKGWEIDPINYQESGTLDGYESGPLNSECGHRDGLEKECAALTIAAGALQLPTIAELVGMLRTE